MTDRLFIAVAPPPAVVDALDALVDPRRDLTPPWRWTPARNWHVTLAFLGNVDGWHDSLPGYLADVARTSAPFRLTLGGGRALPDPRNAKVVVLGATAGADAASRLAQRVRTACSRAGIPPDGARFLPHLTLARCGRGASARALLEIADSFGEFSWEVTAFTLFTSWLQRSGPRYRALDQFKLHGTRPPTAPMRPVVADAAGDAG